MKNPFRNLRIVLGTVREIRRRHPGVFRWADACLQLDRVLLPDRFHYRAAGRALRRETRIEAVGEGIFRIDLPRHELSFFWNQEPADHLWYLVEQEFDARAPHCYTTAPIALQPQSVVLDVGACEGLFAFRIARAGRAGKVLCFEPDANLAALIRRGATHNRVAAQLRVEPVAAARRSGRVTFAATDNRQAGRILEAGAPGLEVTAMSLDDYCRAEGLRLTARDLIKIDAEGADLDVLQGAEGLLREARPQVAVTTYHTDAHCHQILNWLRDVQPAYRFRLKGFAFWTERPRPVLLQAVA